MSGADVMTDKIVPLSLAAEKVNKDALCLAEETVERLKRGEVIAVAIIEVRKAGTVATAVSKSSCYHALNSGAARLASHLASLPDND